MLRFSIWKMGRGVLQALCGIWAAPRQTLCLGDSLIMESASFFDFCISFQPSYQLSKLHYWGTWWQREVV